VREKKGQAQSLSGDTRQALAPFKIMFASHHVHLIKPFQLPRSDGDAKIGICGADFSLFNLRNLKPD
jgi:hypothetical protein